MKTFVAENAASSGRQDLDVVRLPRLTPYLPMWERQRALATARQQHRISDLLVLLEHPHVYTNGRGGRREHLLPTRQHWHVWASAIWRWTVVMISRITVRVSLSVMPLSI